MNHSLTDEKLKKLFWDHAVNTGWDEYDWTSDGMRAAYDKGADWQLEQVIKWLKTTKYYLCPSVLADQLQEAMRPQEDN